MEDLYRYTTYTFSILLVLAGEATRIYDKKIGILFRVLGFTLVLAYSLIVVRDLFAKSLAVSR